MQYQKFGSVQMYNIIRRVHANLNLVIYIKIISRAHVNLNSVICIKIIFPFWVGERGAEAYRVETNFSIILRC